jgi:hypothetical protein
MFHFSTHRRLAHLFLVAAFWLPEANALAMDPAASDPEAGSDAELDGPEPAPIPPATDLLGGHPLLGVAGKLALPFGRLDSDRSLGSRAGGGYGAAGDLGVGLSRSIELGVWADYLVYGEDEEDCPGCETQSFGIGPFVRYHLVQGVRFDPFLSLGAGYRGITISDDGSKTTESSLAWLKLGLGATWYALAQIGFGPFVELELATLTDTQAGADPSVFASFGGGLRLQFDIRGR